MLDPLATILDLEADGDYRVIGDYVRRHHGSLDLLNRLVLLLKSSRFFEAYALAKTFEHQAVQNPVLSLARGIGGLLFGNAADEVEGGASLARLVDGLPPHLCDYFAYEVMHPATNALIARINIADQAMLARLLDLYKAGFPRMRAIFDWTAAPAPLLAAGTAARLLPPRCPPAGAGRRDLRVIVAIRELVFPGRAGSRLLDVGPRLTAALDAYGWRASHLPMRFTDLARDFADIVDACEQQAADLVLLDDWFVLEKTTHASRAAMIARLRRTRPGLKIVSINLDAWMIDPATMVETAAMLDGIWTGNPGMPIWQTPALAARAIYLPLPTAVTLDDSGAGEGRGGAALPPRLTFAGGLFGYNWHRAFWLLGATHGLPIERILSPHTADGLPVLDSYRRYLERLGAAGCALNFAMRPDLSCLATGRTFEIPAAGALLIQEESPDLGYFMVRGEHYLGFSTVPELRAVARFIAEQPEQAQAIRAAGHAFARARYSDQAIVATLDWSLFHREPAP